MAVSIEQVAAQARENLLRQVLPWWLERALDHRFGGIQTMISEQGELLGEDKFVWSQARWLWVCSAVCNRMEANPALLSSAEGTAHFLRAFGRQPDGRWNYRLGRDGSVLEGHTSIFSDCFAVYGLSEYYRLSSEQWAIDLALETFHSICARVEAPSFQEIAPYAMAPGTRAHAVPMILIETAQELSASLGGREDVDAVANACFDTILERFLQPSNGLVLEYLDRDYSVLDSPEGSLVVPGHAIECMWFLAHWSLRHGRQDVLSRIGETVIRHLEFGWDPEHGGLFLNGNVHGDFQAYPHGEMKIWWPHTEALYATALLFQVTGDPRYADWYARVSLWSEEHFVMPSGEWRQRLLRDGKPSDKTIALPVKDPFHLPRALLHLAMLPSTFATTERAEIR